MARSVAAASFALLSFMASVALGAAHVPPCGRVAPRVELRRAPPSKERDAAVDACVVKLMQRMDALPDRERVRAKVGQMVQWAVEGLTGEGDLATFERRVRAGEVGSFLYAGNAAEAVRYQHLAVEESPLGIPMLFAWDVIHGMRTIFPTPLAMASTWNTGAVTRAALVAGREAAEDGVHWTFAPMIDIARDPRWGRIVESAGEDQFLSARMGEAHIAGFSRYLLTCAKHFAAYGAVEGGRDYNTTDMSLRRLHDVYLVPFAAAAKAGADTFMTSFNDLNGVPSTINTYLLREVLRDRYGSQAVVVSDWNAVSELLRHGVVRTRSAAAVAAANAGVDIDMQSGVYADELAAAVVAGHVPEATIDDAVRRILRLKAEVGLFDDPYGPLRPASPLDRATAREVAEESIVLLRNDGGLLPLASSIKRIALIGRLADEPHDHLGSWEAFGRNEDTVTIRAGLSARAAKANAKVTYVAGNDNAGFSAKNDIAAAVDAAAASDIVVLVLGENAGRTGEASSVQSIDLPGNQRELVRAVQATGKPIIAVLMNGRPLVLPPESDTVPALVEGWQLGTEMGSAIANVLFGDKNPSGRLPVSFPAATSQIPVHHQMVSTGKPATFDKDGKPVSRFSSSYLDGPNAPRWPFGFGLSYTTFEIGAPKLSATSVTRDQTLVVDVPVKNTGKRRGKQTVQVYSRWDDSPLTQPLRKLCAFSQVDLAAGERRVLRIPIAVADLTTHDNNGQTVPPLGSYRLYVGDNADATAEIGFVVR